MGEVPPGQKQREEDPSRRGRAAVVVSLPLHRRVGCHWPDTGLYRGGEWGGGVCGGALEMVAAVAIVGLCETGSPSTPEVPTRSHGTCSPILEEAGSFRPA